MSPVILKPGIPYRPYKIPRHNTLAPSASHRLAVFFECPLLHHFLTLSFTFLLIYFVKYIIIITFYNYLSGKGLAISVPLHPLPETTPDSLSEITIET